MCQDCWQDYGSPVLVNPAIAAAVALIDRVYKGTYVNEGFYPGHAAGGNLHTMLDDWNLECSSAHPYTPSYSDAPHQLAVERACYDQLCRLTLEERASALAWYDGYITADIPGAPVERSWRAGRR
jgi:hypothetical protein